MKRIKRFYTSVFTLSILTLPVSPVIASGSGNDFEDFQVGVDYTVYEVKVDLNLNKKISGDPKLNPGGDEGLMINYSGRSKTFSVKQSFPLKGVFENGRRVRTISIKNEIGTLFAFCPASLKRCNSKDVKRFGGYLNVTLPGDGVHTATDIQISTNKNRSISGKEIARIARGLIAVTGYTIN